MFAQLNSRRGPGHDKKTNFEIHQVGRWIICCRCATSAPSACMLLRLLASWCAFCERADALTPAHVTVLGHCLLAAL